MHYAQDLAYKLAPKMIRANTVSPGNTYFDGGIWQWIEKNNPDALHAGARPEPDRPHGQARGGRPRRRVPGEPRLELHHRHQPRHRRRPDPGRAALSGDTGFSAAYARLVALLGGAMILLRRRQPGAAGGPALGTAPAIPEARPQGIPTLKMPTARGWAPGQTPIAAPGLKVNAFATGLKHPRWIQVLPNGDVLAAEALTPAGPASHAVRLRHAHARCAAPPPSATSPNRITLLRDADGDGVAETRETFLDGLNQPFGMALVGDTLLRRQHRRRDGLSLHAGRDPDRRARAAGSPPSSPAATGPAACSPSPDGRRLYVGVGSLSNIGESGMAAEEGRAGHPRARPRDRATAASSPRGLRNPVGLAWEPATGVLWTVVNERDGLGDETPPDYLTSVVDGGFYGWPYCYWGRTVDDRVPQDAGDGREGAAARLRARRPYRLARPLLAARRHAARLPRRHGDRPARLVEPQHAERLPRRLRAVRGRPPRRAAARHPDRLPVARREAPPTAARSASPSAPTARCWSPTTSAT